MRSHEEVIIDTSELPDDDLEPKTTNGTAWYAYLASQDNKLTTKMEVVINKIKSEIGEVTEGTIGEYVKNQF